MCMQDLSIDARLTWRRMAVTDHPTIGAALIPKSPLRVALAVWDIASDLAPSVVMIAPPFNIPVNKIGGDATAGYWYESVLTIHKYPGLFNSDLVLNVTAANANVYECVMDSSLSMAVQKINETIGP